MNGSSQGVVRRGPRGPYAYLRDLVGGDLFQFAHQGSSTIYEALGVDLKYRDAGAYVSGVPQIAPLEIRARLTPYDMGGGGRRVVALWHDDAFVVSHTVADNPIFGHSAESPSPLCTACRLAFDKKIA